jgi:hypothetical protein
MTMSTLRLAAGAGPVRFGREQVPTDPTSSSRSYASSSSTTRRTAGPVNAFPPAPPRAPTVGRVAYSS